MDDIVDEYLEKFKKKHPELIASAHPGISGPVFSTSWSGTPSLISKDELKILTPSNTFDEIAERVGKTNDAYIKLYELTNKCKEDTEWRNKFIKHLLKKGDDDGAILSAVLTSIDEANFQSLLRKPLLSLIENDSFIKKHPDILSRILNDKFNQQKKSLSNEKLSILSKILGRLWSNINQIESSVVNGGWYESALNHPSSSIIDCWLKIMSNDHLNYEQGSNITQEILHTHFSSVIEGHSLKHHYAIAELAANLDYLFSVDSEWVKENFIQLFDPDIATTDKLHSAWAGWGRHGRLYVDILETLHPFYIKLLKNNLVGDLDSSDSLINHYANIILFACEDPFSVINNAVTSFNEKAKNDIHQQIHYILKELNKEEKQLQWKRWITEYLNHRLQGLPQKLTVQEYDAILHWGVEIEDEFEDFVNTIIAGESYDLVHTRYFFSLEKTNLLEKYPNSVVQLLVHLTDETFNPTNLRQIKKLYDRIVNSPDIEQKNIDRLKNHLISIGCIQPV